MLPASTKDIRGHFNLAEQSIGTYLRSMVEVAVRVVLVLLGVALGAFLILLISFGKKAKQEQRADLREKSVAEGHRAVREGKSAIILGLFVPQFKW